MVDIDDEDCFIPDFAETDIRTGAAADSADSEATYALAPRLVRYALISRSYGHDLKARILAEVSTTAPDLADLGRDWVDGSGDYDGLELAAALDEAAVVRDMVALRSLSDCVRLVSLSLKPEQLPSIRRVAAALSAAVSEMKPSIASYVRADAERVVVGWMALASGAVSLRQRYSRCLDIAWHVGGQHIRAIVEAAEDEARASAKPQTTKEPGAPRVESVEPPVEEGFVRVCRVPAEARKSFKTREIIVGLEHIVAQDVPLVPVPKLSDVADVLNAEFPHAISVVAAILTDLTTRSFVHFTPTVLVGDPGSGKSRFVRRLTETLGVGFQRVDAGRADSGAIAGMDRRWQSAEASHPLMAIARTHQANPVMWVDEVEKAATRTDVGRFWDSLLPLLEAETSASFMDPALQTLTDLSWVSYIATANDLTPLPAALRDRMRAIDFPTPGPEHLDALLPLIRNEIARDGGVDPRFLAPLDATERDALLAVWRGGSLRRLRRYVERLIQLRDAVAIHQ